MIPYETVTRKLIPSDDGVPVVSLEEFAAEVFGAQVVRKVEG